MRALSALAVTLTLALALTACGDNSDDSATPISSTQGASASADGATDGATDAASPAATSVTTPALRDLDDQVIATRAVLMISDMPTGWQAEPNEDNDDSETDQELADCVGVDSSEVENDANGSADSDDFKSPEGVTISSSAEVAADEAWTTHAFEILSSEQLRSCLGEALQQELSGESQDVEWGEVKVSPMVFPTYGDELTAFRMQVTARTENGDAVVSSDMLMARVGRGMVTLSATSTSGPVGATELGGYLQTVVERMKSELGDS